MRTRTRDAAVHTRTPHARTALLPPPHAHAFYRARTPRACHHHATPRLPFTLRLIGCHLRTPHRTGGHGRMRARTVVVWTDGAVVQCVVLPFVPHSFPHTRFTCLYPLPLILFVTVLRIDGWIWCITDETTSGAGEDVVTMANLLSPPRYDTACHHHHHHPFLMT